MQDSNKISVIFMGTPNFSASILKNLINNEGIEIVAVYTAPDRIRKRGNKLDPTPVKTLAKKHKLKVETPKNFKDQDTIMKLKSYKPDFICVAAYSAILPKNVLNLPKYDCLNVHASLLPRWRGAAPIQRAILSGDEYSGVCIMRMEEGLDTGDYCKCSKINISDMSVTQIEDKFAYLGSVDLLDAMKQIIEGKAQWYSQDESIVTYAHKLEKRELWLNHNDKCMQAYRKVLASNGTHPSKCCVAGKNLTIINCAVAALDNPVSVCQVTYLNKHLYLGFSDGCIELLNVKPDGKNIMDIKSFASGLQGVKSKKLEWSQIR